MRSDGDVILGTVVMSMPEYGLAIVETCGGTRTIKESVLCYLPYSDATCGALLQVHIQDGSSVVCLRFRDNPDVGCIITSINMVLADMSNTLNGRVFYNTNSMTTNDTTIFDSVIDQVKDFAGTVFQNHANNVDKDVLPGDVDIVNNGGPASVHVGKYLVQIKGSPMAYIDVSAFKDQIRMIASKIEQHTLTTFSHIGDDVSVHDMATSPAEAFGLADGSDVAENWEDVEAAAVPFFRFQDIAGAALDGRESLVVAFPQDTDMHTDTSEPPVLYKDRIAVSGERTVASANRLQSIKTPDIRGVLQFGYNYVNPRTTEDEPRKLDLMTPYEREFDEEENEEETPEHNLNQEVMDAAINKVVDKILTEDYMPVLLKRMTELGLSVSAKTMAQSFIEHTETGPTTAPQYDLPKFLQLTDPVTGKTHVYYDSTSFISQEPDGSILICDGYGSEIRMSQGHIYISPALDLQLRPGRDMWGLVPRHMALDSQGYAIINSNKAVYLRSTGDMQLAAAAKKDGHGKLTLECNDKSNSTNSGIIIRSLGNAAFTSHDMYIGLNSGTSETEGRIEETAQGAIIIDAGQHGTIMSRSSIYTIDSEVFTAVGSTGGTNGALVLSGNTLCFYVAGIVAPSSVIMTPINGTQKVNVVRNGEVTSLSLTTASAPGIQLKGSMVIDNGNLAVNGSILAMQTVLCRNSYYVNYGQIREDSESFKSDLTIKNQDPFTELENATGAPLIVKLTQTIYQDAYVAGNCFRFPENYGVADTITIPGMVWQEATRKALGDISEVAWKTISVEDPDGKTITACYPGWTVWQSATITQAGYETKPLIDNYITNTKQENTNA